jgi:sucrose-6-phosphate hydrolase SacC (GH32 family)
LRVPEGGQAQELAFSNDRGRTWTKYAGNPVLSAAVKDFRDPKVFWHAATARWVMAVVLPDARKAQFYASTDLKAWALLSEFEAPFEDQGIWECPDLLPLPVDGSPVDAPWLFKVDVFGGHPSGGTGARLFFGHFDGTRFTAEPEAAPQWADFGADFYAALSWADVPQPDPHKPAPQRAVWLAWMNCHRYAKHLPTSPWRGAMSVPRELHARRGADGRWQLLQRPLPALAGLRGPVQHLPACTLRDAARDILRPSLDGGQGQHALDIELSITAATAGRSGLRLRVGSDEATAVGHDAERGVVFVDRSRSGYRPPGDALYARRHEVAVPAPSTDRPLRLRALLDGCLLEVFVGDGESVISEQIFPAAGSDGLQLFAEGGSADFGGLHLWPMRAASAR